MRLAWRPWGPRQAGPAAAPADRVAMTSTPGTHGVSALAAPVADGIAGGTAAVAWAEPPEPEAPRQEKRTRDEAGLAWVEAGVLHVRNPRGRGRWASVVVPDQAQGFTLEVNGEVRRGEVVVQQTDRVVLRTEPQEVPARILVEVAADEMAAWVTVQPGRRVLARVADAPPSSRLELQVLHREEPLPEAPTREDVLRALQAEGVLLAPAEEALTRALARPGERVLLVSGQFPTVGGAGVLWTLIHGELPLDSFPEATATGVRSRPRPSVEIGSTLARVEVAGTEDAGMTVRGRPLASPAAWEPELVAGPGVLLSADGRAAIAAAAGHPVVEVRRDTVYVSVCAELQVPGDVDEARGHVSFPGDIWIAGDVQPERLVLAEQNLEIEGNVLRSRIEAGGGIQVWGAATHSLLRAGGPGLSYARALAPAEELAKTLGRGAVQAACPLAFRVCQELAREDVRLDEAVQALLEPLRHLLRCGPAVSLAGHASVRQAVHALQTELPGAIAVMRQAVARRAGCVVRHLDHTAVEATGDACIGEAGSIHSTVSVLGEVRALGPVRGGTVFALGGAQFTSVGAAVDVPTTIQLGPQAVFRADEVRPGTSVYRGDRPVRRFDQVARDVCLRPDGEG
jgi:hypothetical protein